MDSLYFHYISCSCHCSINACSGVLLVSSLMTLPVAASIRIAKGFKQTIFFSILFGEIAVIGGMFASYQLDLAPWYNCYDSSSYFNRCDFMEEEKTA